MRLIVDRKAMLDQVASGYGRVAQRPVRAVRRGLRQVAAAARAGHRPGQVAARSAPASRASRSTCTRPTARPAWSSSRERLRLAGQGRGRHDQREQRPELLRQPYLKLAFSVDFWGTRSYLNQVQQGSLPTSPYNETHWPPKTGPGSNFVDLYNQALAGYRRPRSASRSSRRCRRLEYDIGGYIIPFFNNLIDGYCTEGPGLQAEQGHPEPGQLRPRLPDHLVRLAAGAT